MIGTCARTHTQTHTHIDKGTHRHTQKHTHMHTCTHAHFSGPQGEAIPDTLTIPRLQVRREWFKGLNPDPTDHSHPDVGDDTPEKVGTRPVPLPVPLGRAGLRGDQVRVCLLLSPLWPCKRASGAVWGPGAYFVLLYSVLCSCYAFGQSRAACLVAPLLFTSVVSRGLVYMVKRVCVGIRHVYLYYGIIIM